MNGNAVASTASILEQLSKIPIGTIIAIIAAVSVVCIGCWKVISQMIKLYDMYTNIRDDRDHTKQQVDENSSAIKEIKEQFSEVISEIKGQLSIIIDSQNEHRETKDNWPSKFTITLEAGELASYTNKILDNKNTFPEGNGDEIVSRLRNYTMQIYLDCYQANDWRVMSANDYLQRRELQEHALDMCELCLPLIQLAKHHFHLETKRMMYWGKKVIDLRDKILNWMKSDKARYAEKFCVT